MDGNRQRNVRNTQKTRDIRQRETREPGKTLAPGIRDRIREMCAEDERPSFRAIRDEIAEEFGEGKAPSIGTIRSICGALPRPDRDDAWTLGSGTVDEARVVMPALRSLIVQTRGRRTFITKAEAAVMAKLFAAYPSIPPFEAHRLAARVVAAGESWDDVSMIHHYIAFEPWTDSGRDYSEAPIPRWETEYEILKGVNR